MKFIADLHIHSHFSIATSKQLVPEYLDFWAALKGIKVVGTGDFTHPGWTKELKEKLVPTGTGLYKLNDKIRLDLPFLPDAEFDRDVSFILSAEISTIYKKNGKVRKVHHVILAPDFETAEGIQAELAKREFNITSDGRPILGLDSRDLLELVLSVSEDILFIPAHIWTPWFSVLGSKSGFDTVQECYGDLSQYIFAVETGLSADAPMLWINSTLDSYTLLSNSDAHSPERLGRNSNIFDTDVSYNGIVDAIKKGDGTTFKGTIDLFPQEGKYHFDGHRKCGIRWSPLESLKHNGICTECGKPVTEGVLNRAAQLADRESHELRDKRLPYTSIIPLKEVLSEIHGKGSNSKFIAREYFNLLKKLGPELKILLEVPPEEIEEKAGALLSEAVFRMRSKRVLIQEGFDGEYGRITLFGEKEILSAKSKDQESLFAGEKPVWERPEKREPIPFDLAEFNRLKQEENREKQQKDIQKFEIKGEDPLKDLNINQKRAATWGKGQCMVIAGPGTGKTRVLTQRIGYLVRDLQVDPSAILAVTFTNKAAVEMKSRICSFIPDAQADLITVATFHALGYTVLKEYAEYIPRQTNFSVIHRHETESIIAEITGESKTKVRSLANSFSNIKQGMGDGADNDVREIFDKYENYLNKENLLDLDDLIYKTNKILSENEQVLSRVRDYYKWILIDEFQDINRMQYDLILKIAGPGPDSNIFVIGDPNQAIYGFRGADVKFIDHFKNDFPGAGIIRLNKSYRCPDIVLKASSSVIGGDDNLSGIDRTDKIQVSVHQTEKSEAEFIARTIERLAGGLRFFSMDSD
ncbi:DNA helicase UvrD, partial [candidate division KSB1 bacterium]